MCFRRALISILHGWMSSRDHRGGAVERQNLSPSASWSFLRLLCLFGHVGAAVLPRCSPVGTISLVVATQFHSSALFIVQVAVHDAAAAALGRCRSLSCAHGEG